MNSLRLLRASLLLAPVFAAPVFAAPSPLFAGVGAALETRVTLERGRALLVDEAGVGPLKRHEGTRQLEGVGHLELAPGSRASVVWPGLGSVELRGPTSISWDPGTDAEDLRLSIGVLERVDLEVRRGRVRLDLPGAWRLEAQLGVFELRSLPVGGVGVRQLAGRSCRASWVGGPGISAPQWIGPGESARLCGTREPVAGGLDGAGAPSWSAVTWPWGEGGVPGAPDLSTGGEAWGDASWPWGQAPGGTKPWERWDWPWGVAAADADQSESVPALELSPSILVATPETPATSRLSAVPETGSVIDPEAALESADESADGALLAGQQRVVDEAPDPAPAFEAPQPAAHDSAAWRGLDRGQLIQGSLGTLQLSGAWVEEELAGGRRRISIPADAGVPLWYFSDQYDYRLFPGSELLLDASGGVLVHQGWVRIFHAQPGRVGARLR